MVKSDEILIPLIRNFAIRWISDICRRFDEDRLKELASMLKIDTLEGALDKASRMEHRLHICKIERPFHPSSHKPPPSKKITPIYIPQTPPETPDRPPKSPPGYSKEKEIEDILARADGDGLPDAEIYALTQLGYFT
jgi:hypothetical protein